MENKTKGNKRLGCKWKVTVTDRDGKIISRQDGENSILTAFLNAYKSCYGATGVDMVDTTGATVNVGMCAIHQTGTNGGPLRYGYTNEYRYNVCEPGFNVEADVDISTFGILVGTGTTPQEPDDYNIETQIAHGTGDNLLEYNAMVVPAVLITATQATQLFTRSFTNNGIPTVSISEICLIAQMISTANGSTKYNIMLLRDVITPEDVIEGATITVEYGIYTTV